MTKRRHLCRVLVRHGVDDEAARGVANVLEREAGHNGQGMASLRLEHTDVAGLDYCERFDRIVKAAGVSCEIDLVVRLKILQRAEKSVAMAGDAHVAGLTRQRRTGDVSDGPGERSVIHALFDDRRKMKTGDRDSTYWKGRSTGRRRRASIRIGERGRKRAGSWFVFDGFMIELPAFVDLIRNSVQIRLTVSPQADDSNDQQKYADGSTAARLRDYHLNLHGRSGSR
jgi:hypothetical protein